MKAHDLHKLFNLLSPDIRAALEHEYESVIKASEFYNVLSKAWNSQNLKLVVVLERAAKTLRCGGIPAKVST